MALLYFEAGVPVQQVRLLRELFATLSSELQGLFGDALRVLIAIRRDQDVLQYFQGMDDRCAGNVLPAIDFQRLIQLGLRLGEPLLVAQIPSVIDEDVCELHAPRAVVLPPKFDRLLEVRLGLVRPLYAAIGTADG